MSKLTLQAAAEELKLADDPTMDAELMAAFPEAMQKKHADAIRAHRLRHQIVATKVANRLVNRLGPSVALDMTEEEGVGLPQVITAFLVAERLLDLPKLWAAIEARRSAEATRIELFSLAAKSIRSAYRRRDPRRRRRHQRQAACASLLEPGLDKVAAKTEGLIRAEVRGEAAARRERFEALGAERGDRRLAGPNCTSSTACSASPRWARARGSTSWRLTRAYTRLGEVLGIDWAQQQVARYTPSRPLGAVARRRAVARFRAVAHRFPQPHPRRGSRQERRALGRAQSQAHRPVPRS